MSRGGRGALAHARLAPLHLTVCGGGEGCATAGWEGGGLQASEAETRTSPALLPRPAVQGGTEPPRRGGGRGAFAQARTESLHLAVRGGGDGFAAAGGFLIVVFFLRHSHSSSFPIVSFIRGVQQQAGRDGTGPKRAAIATRDNTRGQAGPTGMSHFHFLFFLLSSFLLLTLLLFWLSLFPWSTTTGGAGQDVTDAGGDSNARRDRGATGTPFVIFLFLFLYSPLFFFSLFFFSDHLFFRGWRG